MVKDESKQQSVDCSVILPVFNEEGCLETVLRRILGTLDTMKKDYEVICVDDGSIDKTWNIITKISQSEKKVKGIKFQRNFGHQIAIYAGIQHSSGQYIAILDADGQDPPELLPDLFQECMKGYDVVYAIRRKRKENIFKRLAYKIFYHLYKYIVPFSVPLDAGDFGAGGLTTDRKNRELEIAYFSHPKWFKISILLLVIGFLLQLDFIQSLLAQIRFR